MILHDKYIIIDVCFVVFEGSGIFDVLSKLQANQYSPLALAFLGDAVYERLVRERILLSGNVPVAKLHNSAVGRVCCEYQAKAYHFIKELLNEDEYAILKRGRNATGVTAPRHSTIAEYHAATGLECLFGWLQLQGLYDRQKELFDLIWDMGNTVRNENPQIEGVI